MKVLIWLGCFLLATILNTLLGYATGFKVGYILFYAAVFFAAKKLCDVWDEHKGKKAAQKIASVQNTQIGSEYRGEVPNYVHSAAVSGWQCSCGRVHPKYESSCVCGKTKIDNRKPEPAPNRFCSKCGDKLIDGSKFCRNCGTEIVTQESI